MTFRLLDLNIWNYNDPWPTRRDLIVELIRETGADLVAPGVTVRDMCLTGDRPNAEGVYPSDHLALVADLDMQGGAN